MNPEPLYVFDTNALVSALLFEKSAPGQAFAAARDGGNILVSQPTFAELSEVLARKKFDRYLTPEEREQFLVAFAHEAIVIQITEEITACRDVKDNKFRFSAKFADL